jgi:LSD1 subclass zinc finger protein
MSIRTFTADDLRWLVCPVCHQPLTLEPSGSEAHPIRCTGCQLRYPIVDGLPVLLASHAVSAT